MACDLRQSRQLRHLVHELLVIDVGAKLGAEERHPVVRAEQAVGLVDAREARERLVEGLVREGELLELLVGGIERDEALVDLVAALVEVGLRGVKEVNTPSSEYNHIHLRGRPTR